MTPNVMFLLQNLVVKIQKAFQFASRIHQTFKQSLYLYEIRKSLDKPIEFEVLKYLKMKIYQNLMIKICRFSFRAKLKLRTRYYKVYQPF